jgi:Bacterial archaeo-eukaryotic release factor family 2
MRVADLAPLFETSGPFLSLYLAAGGDVENAAARLEVRWKTARGDLQEQEVPLEVLEAADPLIEGGHTAGETLAVIVPADGGAYVAGLDTRLAREVLARWAALPYVLPLLAYAQSQVPFVAVLASRASAEIVARLPDGERTEQVEGEQGPHLHRSSPGGWSQPRHQHRAEVLWERNAGEVAELVGAEARRDAGDLMGRFAQERGRGPGGLATEGAEATLAALAKSQVEVLLVADDPDDDRRAWFGALPQQLGLDRDRVEARASLCRWRAAWPTWPSGPPSGPRPASMSWTPTAPASRTGSVPCSASPTRR